MHIQLSISPLFSALSSMCVPPNCFSSGLVVM